MNRLLALVWVYLLCVVTVKGEEWIFGSKYVENINSTTYRGDIQIWAVERGEEDYMFFATTGGLSVWDGVRWDFYKIDSDAYLRCLYYDKTSGILYAGGDNEFGCWKRNKYGDFEYERFFQHTDITNNRIFWRCYAYGNAVYFQTHEAIYRWDMTLRRAEELTPDGYINYLHLCGNRLLVQLETDFYLLEGLQLKKWEVSIPNRVVNVVERQGAFYFFSEEEGIFVYKNGILRKWNETTNKLLKKAKVFAAGTYGAEQWAVGTVLNGFYLLDSCGNIIENVNNESGLQNTTVLSYGVDGKENIWLGLDGGIARIYRDVQEKYYQSFTGEIGSVYTVKFFNGSLFLGTNKGLFELKKDNSLHFIAGSQGQVWDIYPIGKDLIVNHDKGIFRVQGGRFVSLPFPGAWRLRAFPDEKELYFSFDFRGLTIYDLQEGRLKLRNRMEGYEGSCNDAHVDKYGYIWLLNNAGHAVRLKTDEDRRKMLEMKSYEVPKEGRVLPRFCNLDNEIIFYTGVRAYCYDIVADTFIYNSYYAGLLEICGEGVISITQWGNFFFYVTHERIGVVERYDGKLINKGYIWGKAAGRMIPQAFRRVIPLSDGVVALGLQNGVAFYNFKSKEGAGEVQPLKLRKIRSVTRNEENWLDITDDRSFIFPFQTKEIGLYFTGLSPFKSVEYRVDEGEWTRVILEDEFVLPYLKAGEHTLYVRNADYGEEAPVFVKKMKFEQPWFLGEKSILFLFVGLIGLGLAVHYWNIRRMKRRHEQLQFLQEEDMRKQQAAHEVEMMRLELKEKDKKLVNFTMEGINQNNMLSEIREEVIGLQKDFTNPDFKIRNIVRKIDSHLNDKENWKVFEKYFNNIYDGFFDRLVSRYPDLTTNELKICAYIKLNLSSKEIAVLLNISPASVEMARHRLRKKLNIHSGVSLINFMAEI